MCVYTRTRERERARAAGKIAGRTAQGRLIGGAERKHERMSSDIENTSKAPGHTHTHKRADCRLRTPYTLTIYVVYTAAGKPGCGMSGGGGGTTCYEGSNEETKGATVLYIYVWQEREILHVALEK